MVRAVRLADDARVRGRGRRRWPGSRHAAELVAPPLGRADRRPSSTSCSRRRCRRSGCGCWPTPGCSRRSPPDLAAQRGIAQNKIAGRGPVGPHAARRSTRRRRAGRSSGWRPCSTTSASRRRSPTATSSATTRSVPSWPARSSTGCARRASVRDRVVAPRPPPHVQLRAELVRRGGPPVHRQDAALGDGDPRGPVRAARGGQRRVRPARRRRAARRAAGAGRGRAGRRGRAGPERARDRRQRPDDRARTRAGTAARAHPRRAARARHRGPGGQRPTDAAAPRPGACSTEDR